MSVAVLTFTGTAAGTVSPGTGVKFDAAGKLTTAGAGEAIAGLCELGVDLDETFPVVVQGPAIAKAGGVLTAGVNQALMCDGSGRLVAYVAAAGNYHVANWIPNTGQLTTAADDEINVFLVGSPSDR